MSTQVDYHLGIRVERPETVVEGEPFKVTYHIKNLGENLFPGGNIIVKVSWANLGEIPFVYHEIKITDALQPNDSLSLSKEETPLASGYTIFSPAFNKKNFIQIQNRRIFLYLDDGRRIRQGMILDAVRAKSHEEILQAKQVRIAAREVRIALVALLLVVLFQIFGWILQYFLSPPYVKTFVTIVSVGLVASIIIGLRDCRKAEKGLAENNSEKEDVRRSWNVDPHYQKALLAEYKATQDKIAHDDRITWERGSILLAAVIAGLAFVTANLHEISSAVLVVISAWFTGIIIMWYLWDRRKGSGIDLKYKRLHDIERMLGLKQHLLIDEADRRGERKGPTGRELAKYLMIWLIAGWWLITLIGFL